MALVSPWGLVGSGVFGNKSDACTERVSRPFFGEVVVSIVIVCRYHDQVELDVKELDLVEVK